MSRLKAIVKRLGWFWEAPDCMVTDQGERLKLQSMAIGAFQHEVREGLRRMGWRRAAGKRHDMEGLDVGVDRIASMSRLTSNKETDFRKGMLRSVLAGAIWTRIRLFKAGLARSPTCQFCQTGEDETQEHIWWRCPAWDAIRCKHPMAIQAFSSDWPSCLKCCGIMPNLLEGLSDTLAYCSAVHSDGDEDASEDELVVEARARQNLASSVQALMTDILDARNAAIPVSESFCDVDSDDVDSIIDLVSEASDDDDLYIAVNHRWQRA